MKNRKIIFLKSIIAFISLFVAIVYYIFFIDESTYILVMISQNSTTDIVNELTDIEGIEFFTIEEIGYIYAENLRLSLYEKNQLEIKIEQFSGEYGFSKTISTSSYPSNSTSNISGFEQLDTEIADQSMWYLDSIKNLNATNYTGFGTKVTIIDSGIDLSIEEITKNINMKESCSYLYNDESFIDRTGHGTMVSGIISTIAFSTTLEFALSFLLVTL